MKYNVYKIYQCQFLKSPPTDRQSNVRLTCASRRHGLKVLNSDYRHDCGALTAYLTLSLSLSSTQLSSQNIKKCRVTETVLRPPYIASVSGKKSPLFDEAMRESHRSICRTHRWGPPPSGPRANHRSNRTNSYFPLAREVRAHCSATLTVKRGMSFLTCGPLLVFPCHLCIDPTHLFLPKGKLKKKGRSLHHFGYDTLW